MKIGRLSGLLFLTFLATSIGFSAPVSSCVINGNGGNTCDFFESLSDGTASEISNSVALAVPAIPGYLVLYEENMVGNPNDPTTWSDVLTFIDDGTGASVAAQLFSVGCNVAAGDLSCFPSVDTVGNASHSFIAETNPVTTFTVGNSIYNIHSDEVNELSPDVPEPATMSLMGLAMAGLGFLKFRKR